MRAVAMLVVLIACGCAPKGSGLADRDLTFKGPAIKQAVEQDKAAAVPQLVHDLDSDDPAVRFYAFEGLRRLTGQDFGYHYFADADVRRPAVDRWKQWLRDRGYAELRKEPGR